MNSGHPKSSIKAEQRIYPFTPKSALKLRFGDYWPVRRSDNFFGFFAFIGRWAHLRSGFTAALLNHAQASPYLDPNGPPIHLGESGHLHIKTFPETVTEVTGNISLRLDVAEVERALDEQQRKSVVWGYRVPVALVNKVEPNTTNDYMQRTSGLRFVSSLDVGWPGSLPVVRPLNHAFS